MTVEAAPASQSAAIARLEAALASARRYLGRGLAWLARAGWPGVWAGLGALLFLLLAHASRAGLYLFGALGILALLLAAATVLGSARGSRRARRLHQAGASARGEAIVAMAAAQRRLFVGSNWLCVAIGIGLAVALRHLLGQTPQGYLGAGIASGMALAAFAGTFRVPRGQMWFIAAAQAPLHLRPGWDAERYAFDGGERLARSIGAADRRVLSALAMADARQGQGVVPRLPFGPWPGRRFWGELSVRGRGAVGYAMIGAIAALLAFFLATATPLGDLTRTAFSGLDALLQPDTPQAPESGGASPEGGTGQEGKGPSGHDPSSDRSGASAASPSNSGGDSAGSSSDTGSGSAASPSNSGGGSEASPSNSGGGSAGSPSDTGSGSEASPSNSGSGSAASPSNSGGDSAGSPSDTDGGSAGSPSDTGSGSAASPSNSGGDSAGSASNSGSGSEASPSDTGSGSAASPSNSGGGSAASPSDTGSGGDVSSSDTGGGGDREPSDDLGSPGTENGPASGSDPSGDARADQVIVSPTDTAGNGTVSQVSGTPGPLAADRGAAPAETLDVVVQQAGAPAKPHDHKPQQIVPVWMQQIIGGRPDQE